MPQVLLEKKSNETFSLTAEIGAEGRHHILSFESLVPNRRCPSWRRVVEDRHSDSATPPVLILPLIVSIIE
jgi:hypothetical protein